tara:strand:- start:674 stop:1336 length:663 start_codon:yes stop_codon:yes gene_type:complete
MKRLEHKGKSCGDVHPNEEHEMWETSQLEGKTEEELSELVDFDGSMLNSKIPLGVNKTNKVSRSTTDDMVKTAHQKGNGFGYYYKRYWGESYQGAALGDNEEIDLMTGQETLDYFEDEHGLSPHKAIEKASGEYGKKVKGSEEALHGTKQRIVELSNKKMRDMLEVLVAKPDNNKMGMGSKEMELHDMQKSNPILDKMAFRFKRACDAQGVSPEQVLNNI